MEEKLAKTIGVRVDEPTHLAFVSAPRAKRRRLTEQIRKLITRYFASSK